MTIKFFTEPSIEIIYICNDRILTTSDINGFIGDYDEFGEWLD